MFGYDNMLNNLNREKRKIEDMIQNYQNQPTPVNNFINTNQMPQKDLIEWRILNENEEVDNLYVTNKTLFINDNMMIIKGVDGSLEKYEVKKIYPIDKKDEKINQLEEEIKKLKEMINNEHSKSNESIGEVDKSNGNVDGNVEPKPKTTSKSISK
jgi:hypothetical protein